MGDIDEALSRAEAEGFTRTPPKTPLAQMRLLTKAHKGSTRAVAERLGVSQRTVERYLAGQRKTPRPPLAAALAREVAKVWQPRIRARRRREAATRTGITIETRARFGYTAPVGTTDDPDWFPKTLILDKYLNKRPFDKEDVRNIPYERHTWNFQRDKITRTGVLFYFPPAFPAGSRTVAAPPRTPGHG